MPDASALQALGVYDPDELHAQQRLELLAYLLELGASAQDLIEFREQLAGLPSVLALRDGRPALTLAEVAERSGIPQAEVLRIASAAGLPRPGPEDRAFTERFVELARVLRGDAADVFGEDVLLQLVRVMGSSMARLADAAVSAFLVNLDPGTSEEDPVGLEVAHANALIAPLLPGIGRALDAILRQHLLLARRSSLGAAAEGGYEKRQMCVGFVDLVGSTGLAVDASAAELGAVLTEFEHVSAELVTAGGGRVVKLIGDEVLFTANDARAACEIALSLAERFSGAGTVPPVRVGLAGGEVMLRDGDVFGQVVNLASRIVGAAGASEVLAPADFAALAGARSRPLPPRQLKGFAGRVQLCQLLPTGSGR